MSREPTRETVYGAFSCGNDGDNLSGKRRAPHLGADPRRSQTIYIPRNDNGMGSRRQHSQINLGGVGGLDRSPTFLLNTRNASESMTNVMGYGSPEDVRPYVSPERGLSHQITRSTLVLAGPDTISPQQIQQAVVNSQEALDPRRHKAAWGKERSRTTHIHADPAPQARSATHPPLLQGAHSHV